MSLPILLVAFGRNDNRSQALGMVAKSVDERRLNHRVSKSVIDVKHGDRSAVLKGRQTHFPFPRMTRFPLSEQVDHHVFNKTH
jgi:hypothetical protein